MKKSYWKIIIGSLSVIISGLGLYAYKLHSLALEGNRIYEQRCLVVNPALIAYKNDFLSFADAVKHPDKVSTELAVGYFQAYLDDVRAYAPKEEEWLKTERAFMDRWDFQLIEPWYIKEAAQYSLKLNEGYRDEAIALIAVLNNPGPKDEIQAKFNDARSRQNHYTYLYNDLYGRTVSIKDLWKIFGTIPAPEGCTYENTTIPNTTGIFDPEPIPAEKPEITG